MKTNISSEWSRHLRKAEDKEEFNKTILHSGILLDRLRDILEGYLSELGREEYTEEYVSPAWPYLQADRLGQKKALTKVLKLVERKTTNE